MGSPEPVPNKGSAVQDEAEGEHIHLVSQHDFVKEWGIDKARQVKLVKLVFMRYAHPDLQIIDTFLKDFGLVLVKHTDHDAWYRGYSSDPYVYHVKKGPKEFLGGAFEVESYQELEKALKIPGARYKTSGIEKMDSAPGGGHIVTIIDPEGMPISLVYGQSSVEPGEFPAKIPVNDENEKPRTRKFLRFKPGPAAVHKLGHYGLCVRDLNAQLDFYLKNFSLMPTNFMYVEDDKGEKTNVGMFSHIDRGDDMVDHHALFISTLQPGHDTTHPHHCSFEVHDINTQALGHDWLTKKGYKIVWGIGRHVLGSQIFDYWWDTTGFMVEHYIDGDLVNKDTPVSFHRAKDAVAAAWGPDIPQEFME